MESGDEASPSGSTTILGWRRMMIIMGSMMILMILLMIMGSMNDDPSSAQVLSEVGQVHLPPFQLLEYHIIGEEGG